MSFAIPDLIIESVIRDGIKNVQDDPTILDDVFAQLDYAYAARKNGAAEIQRIKDYLTGANQHHVAVVHSFHEAVAKSPAISIQLGSDTEARDRAYLDDFDTDLRENITDAGELAALTKVSGVIPTSYDPVTGMVSVADSVDLSVVYAGYIYVDGSANEWQIASGISDVTGSKFFFIDKNVNPDIGSAGSIKTFITENQLEIRSSYQDVQILIGIHSKEALLTKYLYTLVKYFMKSRKHDLINRCFQEVTMSGSDFTKDLAYEGDQVYTRFLTVMGKVEEAWRSDQVVLVDSLELTATPIE